jgi:heme-degrading monooxygenase HmoA
LIVPPLDKRSLDFNKSKAVFFYLPPFRRQGKKLYHRLDTFIDYVRIHTHAPYCTQTKARSRQLKEMSKMGLRKDPRTALSLSVWTTASFICYTHTHTHTHTHQEGKRNSESGVLYTILPPTRSAKTQYKGPPSEP